MLTGLIILIIIIASIGYYFTRLIIAPAVSSEEQIALDQTSRAAHADPVFGQLPKQQIFEDSIYGYKIHGIYSPRHGAQRTVVLCHDLKKNLYSLSNLAVYFHQQRYNVLLWDLRRHGLSGGKTISYGYYEKHDLQVMYDWALDQLGPQGIVGTYGVGCGAAIALQHAALEEHVDFVISDSAFSDLYPWLVLWLRKNFNLPAFPLLDMVNMLSQLVAGFPFEQVTPQRDIQGLDIPMLFIHSRADRETPLVMAQSLFGAKMLGSKELYMVNDAPYAEIYQAEPQAYEQKLTAFLEQVISELKEEAQADF